MVLWQTPMRLGVKHRYPRWLALAKWNQGLKLAVLWSSVDPLPCRALSLAREAHGKEPCSFLTLLKRWQPLGQCQQFSPRCSARGFSDASLFGESTEPYAEEACWLESDLIIFGCVTQYCGTSQLDWLSVGFPFRDISSTHMISKEYDIKRMGRPFASRRTRSSTVPFGYRMELIPWVMY